MIGIEWFEREKINHTKEENELIFRCLKTLDGNILAGEDMPWYPNRAICPGVGGYDGIWNWDTAFHSAAVARWDTELAKEGIRAFFKFQKADGFLPDVIWTNGEMEENCSKPPVMAWSVGKIYNYDKDMDFVAEMYPKLVKNAYFWEKSRMFNGLFYYSCQDETKGDRLKYAGWESGWDDSVRWDTPITDLWAIDLNCFAFIFYREMEYFAGLLKKDDEAVMWNKLSCELADRINEELWDDDAKCYVDANRFTHEKSKVITPASFMPLYAEIAPKERAKCMARLAFDKDKFYSGMPTVAYDDKEFDPESYWRGPCWLNVAYFAVSGLKKYGFSVAKDIKNTIIGWCMKNSDGIYENYNSVTGKGLKHPRFSWSSAFIIEFIYNI